MILPALAIALIGLIQAAAISQSIANPDGDYPDASQDFIGQGIEPIWPRVCSRGCPWALPWEGPRSSRHCPFPWER